jgi:hypothetical protein
LVGRYNLATNTGEIESISVAGSPVLHYFDLKRDGQPTFAIHDDGATARLANGKRMQHLRFAHNGSENSVELEVVDDFASLDAALATVAQDRNTFATPRSLLNALPEGFVTHCCDDKSLPPPRVVASEVTADVAAAQALKPYCGACHGTAESTPPNFLYGDATRVRAALTSCASRITVRLAMWDLAPVARQKTPMPPALPAQNHDANRIAPVSSDILRSLKKAVTELAFEDGRPADPLSALLVRNYETLPPCLSSQERNHQ